MGELIIMGLFGLMVLKFEVTNGGNSGFRGWGGIGVRGADTWVGV